VTRAGVPIELTVKEYQILEVLMRRPGEVILRRQIEEEIWGQVTEVSSNAVDVHISHLRGKIDTGQPTRLLGTVRGRGYYVRKVGP